MSRLISPSFSALGWALGWALGTAALVAVGACTYDFEAAFEQTPSAGGSDTVSTGGSGGSPATTSTGGVGGQGGGENCGNGMDDDMDGDVDCEDSDCTSHACVDPPPMGWTAVAFNFDASNTMLPACPSVWPTTNDLSDGINDPDATCNCSCGAASVTCSLEDSFAFASNTSCLSMTATMTPAGNGVCTTFNAADFDSSRGEAPQVLSANCPPMELPPTLPPISWDNVGRVCQDAALGAGCEMGQVCAPQAAAPFRSCIAQDGNQSCPPPFDDKTLLYGGFNEGRSCSTCSCGNPSGAQCSAATDIWYQNDACNGTANRTIINNNQCEPDSGPSVNNGSFRYTAVGTANSCNPQSNPTGSATPAMPTTVCCTP